MNKEKVGLAILRFGLATLFLWFGFSQLFDGKDWVSWVPQWAVQLIHLPPAMIVLLNGALEVVGGALLAMDLLVAPVALILALHLLVIAVEIGITAIGVRDFGLMCATFALMFLSSKPKTPKTPEA